MALALWEGVNIFFCASYLSTMSWLESFTFLNNLHYDFTVMVCLVPCIAFCASFYRELTALLKTSGVILSFEEDLVVILKDGACISTIIYFQDSTPGNDASYSSSFTVTMSNTALEAYVGI